MALNFGNITLVEDEPEIIKKPIDFGTIKLVEEPVEQPKLDFGAIKPIEEIGLPKPTFEAPTFEEEAKVTAAPNTTAIQAPVEKPNIVPKVLWVSQRGAEKVESHMGLAYGLDQIGMNLGSIIEYGGNKLDVEKMADLGQKIYKHYSERPAVKAGVPEEIKGQVWEKPELMLDPKWWSFNISQIAPSLAIAMVPALAAKNIITVGGTALKLTPKVVGKLATLGASLTGGITGGTLEGASTYQEMKTDPEVTEQEAQVAAEMMACGSAALNALSVGRLLTKLPKGVLSSGLHRAVTGAVEAITEWLEEPIEVIAKRMAKKEIGDIPETVKEAVQAIKEGANVVGPSFLLGALTGGIQIPKEAKVAELESVTEAKQDEGVLEETEEKPEGAEIKLTTEEETGLKEAIKIDYQRGGLSEEEASKQAENFINLLSKEKSDRLKRVYSQEKRRANYDNLTGLKNRNWAERNGKTKLEKARLVPADGKQIFIDINKFGQINKDYGEVVGDDILRFFGPVLNNNVGDLTDAMRWGGDEFVLHFKKGVKDEDVFNALQDAQEEFNAEEFADGKAKNLSFSAGFAETSEEADHQMRMAKKIGTGQLFIGGKKYEIQSDTGKITRAPKTDTGYTGKEISEKAGKRAIRKGKGKISGGLGAGLGEKVDFPDIYSFVKMTEKEALKNPPKGFTFGKLPDKE
ncbi:MAG: GGDEF domain-containing protein, partial [Candidatus Margulisiibacteriota bacterium]